MPLPIVRPASTSLLALSFLFAATPAHAQQQTPLGILTQFRQATGGSAWDHIEELRSEGTATGEGKTGSFDRQLNLVTGANLVRIQVPAVNFFDDEANTPGSSWELNPAGDIQLHSPGNNPWEIDDLYLVRHAYWQPEFAGAAIHLLPPANQDKTAFDRLQITPAGGHGFILSFDRNTHLLARVAAEGSPTTYLSDYRRVDGLLLPFRRQRGHGPNQIVEVTTSYHLLRQAVAADFQPAFHTDYTMPASGHVTVPLTGIITLNTKLNGKGPFNTVFDTGAVNLLSEKFAQQLGLKVDTTTQKFGAIGGAITVRTAHLDTLTIGDLTVRDQTFYVLPIPDDSGAPSLAVGYELMRRFAIKVDFDHQQITFYDAPHFHYTGPATRIPLLLARVGNGVELNAELDGTAGKFTLDTGNQIGLFLNADFVNNNDLVHRLNAHFRGYNGKGFGGDSPDAWFTRAHTLRMGDIEFKDPVVRLQTKSDGFQDNAGNIGQSTLTHFNMVIDCMRASLYLEKNSTSSQREVFPRAGLLYDPVNGIDTVKTVLPGSPAQAAGLQPGDRITSIAGKPPADDPSDPAFAQPAGTVVPLTIERNGAVERITLTLKDIL